MLKKVVEMPSRAFHLSIDKVKGESYLKSFYIFVCERDLSIPFSNNAWAGKKKLKKKPNFIICFNQLNKIWVRNWKTYFAMLHCCGCYITTQSIFRSSLEVPALMASYSRYKRILASALIHIVIQICNTVLFERMKQ